MSENITREAITFRSADGETSLRGYIWKDPSRECPRGIVQIVHGMSEHALRYDDFARFLAENGFIVAGHDQLGHGDSVKDEGDWGNIPVPDGARLLVEDVHALRSIVTTRTSPALPYFLFGHSMGSFVTRSYITCHAPGLSGAIICGTGHIPPLKSNAGRVLAQAICKIKGERHRSGLLHGMSVGAYGNAIDDARTSLDWLSFNPDNVDAYIADERCGFMFTAAGNVALTTLTGEVCTPASAKRIPRDLSLLYIAGWQDPVGENGKGVLKAAELARNAGISDIEVKLYEGMRHEILNEAESALVYSDVLSWLEEHLPS